MASPCSDTRRVLLPAGTILYRQSVTLPSGRLGHVYRHEGRGEWYTVEAAAPGVWRVCTYTGGVSSCPCGR